MSKRENSQNTLDVLIDQRSDDHSNGDVAAAQIQQIGEIVLFRRQGANRFVQQKRMNGVENGDVTFEQHGTVGLDVKFST